MSNFLKRLDSHFVASAAVAGAALMGTAQQSEAAIVHSGAVNLNIASTTNGLYLNVVTGAINEPGNTGGGTVPGWDINLWSGTALNFFNPAAPAGGVYVQVAGSTANLPAGSLIDAASTYGNTSVAANWNLSSSNNLLGFRFQHEGDSMVHFGWARISLGATIAGQPRALVEYAYESVAGRGIGAGEVPAPGAGALLGLGAVGLFGRRRR